MTDPRHSRERSETRICFSGWTRFRRFWSNTIQQEVDDEFAFHFRMRVDQFIADGMSREDAERSARERFGDAGAVRDRLIHLGNRRRRHRDWRETIDGFVHDVVIAIRALRREPVFTLGVVLTLGLGIGANATMFGIVENLMLRGPAHVVDSRQTARLYITLNRDGTPRPATRSQFGWVTYAALRDRAKSFDAVAAYSSASPINFGSDTQGRPVPTARATWDLFPALGVRPVLGRFFDRTEDHPPVGEYVAVISEELWRSEFSGAIDVLGKRVQLGGSRYTIVGVAPRHFTGVERAPADVWVPMSLTNPTKNWETSYGAQWLRVFVRLKSGVTPAQASDEATRILRAAYTGDDPAMRRLVASVRPIWYANNGQPSPVANVSRWLMGVAVVVLVITCANVANLLVARSRRRRREVAVRLALGAGRARLVRFILTETVVLALGGAGAATLVAFAGGRLMRDTLLSGMVWDDGGVSRVVFAFSLSVALIVGLLVGLAPAMDATRVGLVNSLRTGVRDGGGRRLRLRTVLSAAQVTLCVVLLIGAGLFVDSLRRSHSVDLGFQPDRVIRAQPNFPPVPGNVDRVQELARRAQLLQEETMELARLPWVEHAAIAVGTPWGNAFTPKVAVPGRDSIPQLESGGPFVSAVTADYFVTVGTPLRRGRLFTNADRAGSSPVAIVNETMANTLWPAEDAIGKCLVIGNDSPPCSLIVGIVGDVHLGSIREQPSMQYYVPFGQERGFGGSVIIVRPRTPMVDAIPALRRAVVANPSMPYVAIETIQASIDPEYRPWQLGATMFGVFGALALVIAAVGLYSVIAYLVADQTRELGVRIALGATRGRVIREVVFQGASTTLVGVALGTTIAFMAGRFIQPLLFGVSARDPRIAAVVGVFVLAIAVLASWSPARRASRVDPVTALRAD